MDAGTVAGIVAILGIGALMALPVLCAVVLSGRIARDRGE